MEKHNIYHFSQAWISKIAKQPNICFNLYLSIYLEETCILNSLSPSLFPLLQTLNICQN